MDLPRFSPEQIKVMKASAARTSNMDLRHPYEEDGSLRVNPGPITTDPTTAERLLAQSADRLRSLYQKLTPAVDSSEERLAAWRNRNSAIRPSNWNPLDFSGLTQYLRRR